MEYKNEFNTLLDYYFSTFLDKINCEEWAKVDEFNKPCR